VRKATKTDQKRLAMTSRVRSDALFCLVAGLLAICPVLWTIALGSDGRNALVSKPDASPEREAEAVPEALPLPSSCPQPQDNPATPAKVAFGQQLFFDPRLSGDNRMSCATCHDPAQYFADGRPVAAGKGGKTLQRNTLSLVNAGFYHTYFWDGRATRLEEAVLFPIQAPDEMDQSLDALVVELEGIPGYARQFRELFGKEVDKESIGKALAAFVRSLVSSPSPYDRYLMGDTSALNAEARWGMELFFGEAGCSVCHRGVLLSDEWFYRLRVGLKDRGRAHVSGKEEDAHRFRTPSLRNVARTAPYFHDGSVKTLYDVVALYYGGTPTSPVSGHRPDLEPLLHRSFSEVFPIVEFLESLTSPSLNVEAPALPGFKTLESTP
jgi:cytochrome c peroxidase